MPDSVFALLPSRRSAEPSLRAARLVTTQPVALRVLLSEFPTVRFIQTRASNVRGNLVDAATWLSSHSFAPFDARLAPQGSFTICGDLKVDLVAMQLLTRYQRFIGRTNAASTDPRFAELRRLHRALHDVRRPLVKADLDHAVDTWQWLLRLDPEAGVSIQIAALTHDLERLEGEANARLEHRAPDYRRFKMAHAAAGAVRAAALATSAGFPRDVARRVHELVAGHEERGSDPELATLNDADALSFFTLVSADYVDWFGTDAARNKIGYTFARMGMSARRKLAYARLRPDVAALVHELLASRVGNLWDR